MKFVVVPGIDDSDEAHWQTRWETEWGDTASRVQVASWTAPELTDWSEAISRAVAASDSRSVVIVAHSLGCLAAAHYLVTTDPVVAGAFLVAPPDPANRNFPAAAATFHEMSWGPLPVPGLVLCSDNDPFCDRLAAAGIAHTWGVPRVTVGAAGHLNSASGFGAWESGRALLTAFVGGLAPRDRRFPAPRFEPVAADDPEVARLVMALTDELARAGYTAEETFGYSAAQLKAAGVRLAGAFVEGELVGIGGIEVGDPRRRRAQALLRRPALAASEPGQWTADHADRAVQDRWAQRSPPRDR